MKKFYFALMFVAVLAIVYTPKFTNSTSALKQVSSLSADELVQQHKQAKIKRRNAGYAKPDKPDEFQKYLNYLKTNNDASNAYPHNHQLNELKGAKLKNAQLKSAKATMPWVQRGPGNVGGRTRGFVIDPADATGNTWFAGSVGGGIWHTTDAGQTWMPISDEWPNMSVACIEMAPSNNDVMYAGTGEGFYNTDAIMGNGIFKSIDHGVSWNLLSSTESNNAFRYINRLAIDKDDENVVYAATNYGIYKSVDGGDNWIKVFQETYNSGQYVRRVQDLRISDDASKVLIAAVNDYGVVRSLDGGNTWELVFSKAEGRIELGYSESDNNVIYALTSKSNLHKSVDGGDNWVAVTFSGTSTEYLGGQGWYDNTLVTYPSDPDKLFIGGVDLYDVVTVASSGSGKTAFDIVDNTYNYFTYADVGGHYRNKGIKVDYNNVSAIENLEVRFGGTYSQKAHRFTVEGSAASVVSDANHVYNSYIDVPFEVWDTHNNKQLMVSFRDGDNDGFFNLTEASVEQIIIHNLEYNASTASVDIAVDGGVSFNKVFVLYPQMQKGVLWQPTTFTNAVLTLNKVDLKDQTQTYKKISDWSANVGDADYVHADHHKLIVDANQGNPFRIISCSDGGIGLSENAGTSWTAPNTGYNTSQFYGVTRHPELERYAGGLQDNGTWWSTENPQNLTAWSEVAGGDGFSTVWNQANPNKFVGCYYNNSLFATYDGGTSWKQLTTVHGFGDKDVAPFITRIENSVSAPDMLLVGSKNGISTSTDFGQNWSLVSVPATAWSAGDYNPQTAISPVNSRYIWAGTTVSANNTLALSKDGGKTYSVVTAPFTSHNANISKIVAHPTDEKSAFVLFSLFGKPKVFVTKDLGETWEELSGFGTNSSSNNGFPNVAVYSLLVMPHNTNQIWAGTEIGLFETLDGGVTWNFADNGLPAVCIWDMKIIGQQVVVGTHGRGVWSVDIPEIPVQGDRVGLEAAKAPNGKIIAYVNLLSDYEKVELFIDDQLVETFVNATVGIIEHYEEYSSLATSIGVQVKATNGNITDISNYVAVNNYSIETPVGKYMNPFSTNKYDFSGSDFKVSKELFGDWAIHSPHSYAEKKDITYMLSYPIVVSEKYDEALLSYRDIALIEAGEPNAVYGEEAFYDYVVVEGTKDGISWKPLADGYDVNFSDKWKSFAGASSSYDNIESVPNLTSLFVDHSINLHETFEAGDVILIRFRLHSDPASVGYGWVIDDLIIQETGTAVDDNEADEAAFTVGPNPATSYIELKLNADERGKVSVAVYDMSGRAVIVQDYYKETSSWSQTIDLDHVSAGTKIVTVSVNGKVYKKKIVCR